MKDMKDMIDEYTESIKQLERKIKQIDERLKHSEGEDIYLLRKKRNKFEQIILELKITRTHLLEYLYAD